MLKQGALVSVSVLALAGTAHAADLSAPRYVKAPPMVMLPAWAGFYMGVQGGVAENFSSFDDIDQAFINDGTITHDISKTGGVFGGNAGYNWQSGLVVWGVETDINWVGAKATASYFGGAELQTGDITWMGSFRGRIGVDYMANLFYATGGVAYGGVKNSVGPTLFGTLVDDKTKVGWTVGAGVEHLFTNHLTARAEVRYTDFGSDTLSVGPYRGKFSNHLLTGMVGLGYKF
jgi:outer membrane immunogenic protein